MDQRRAAALKALFRRRNEVAHAGAEPTSDETKELLYLVRDTVDDIQHFNDRG